VPADLHADLHVKRRINTPIASMFAVKDTYNLTHPIDLCSQTTSISPNDH